MVGSTLALSLVGFAAVQALPVAKTVEERQIWIGPGSGVFIPGDPNNYPPCFTDVPLNEQPPCLLPPIVGPIEPSTKAKRQATIGGGSTTITPGDGDELPTCLAGIPVNEQPPCLLAPITGPIEPSTKAKRQITIGDGSGTITPGDPELPECLTDVPLNEQPPCFLTPIGGGVNPSTKKRSVVLPPDFTTNPKKAIAELKAELTRLQNKKNKTKQDRQDIAAIKAALKYLATLPGSGSTFTPGKRGFVLPPDFASNPKQVIIELEAELIRLQNKQHKTTEDLQDIAAIKAALTYIAGVTGISAPPGTGSSFTPGKRDGGVDTVACPNLDGAEIAFETLIHSDAKTPEERYAIEQLAAFLKSCGITIVASPDGTYTIIKPSD
ncbi:uncharacterized protein C8A04DRAFT_33443 [Dichotomopilus funicola]|uniref:Uncharacterized protein n=1 Tax=Dichotomopilus funicola TaxID=1934379 RepID=A0AAN6UV00_9PEZI|nr:hypothetical protein C8A04DRAFT_33443 [Dichotomopilus funicola]